MKFDFIKNRVLFVSICIFLATVLVLLSVWKQQTPTIEGMVVMDFLTPSGTNKDLSNNELPNFTDMDLQGFISALIPFERKFETIEKGIKSIEEYKKSFNYDPSGNATGDVNLEGISIPVLDKFISHLSKTSDAFKVFSEALSKMKKDKIDDYTQKLQASNANPQTSSSSSTRLL